MLTYWLLFLVPAWMALSESSRTQSVRSRYWGAQWVLAWVLLTCIVGWRHDVGGDWLNYLGHYEEALDTPLPLAFAKDDPGYHLLLWAVTRGDWGVYCVNLFSAAVFSAGLIAFCRQQPRPWLALTVAIPYTVIVLGMGYTRQGVALGFALLGLVSLKQGRLLPFVAWVALGATFHKSAVLLVPLAVLATPRNRLWTVVWVGLSAFALYKGLLADSVDRLVTNYIDAGYQSEGAAIRVMMNVVPAALLLWWRKRFHWTVPERNLWTMLSVLALLSVAWLMASPSSTAVDRVALYLIPLQMYVFSRLPELLSRRGDERMWVGVIVTYYAAVEAVWLFFATHAFAWLPYQFYPWIWLWE
ncbi:MAG: hypothetical protein A3G29_03385 [Burkholderiales bacterium RIFCSPLOWO2_12_FULL_64_99]|nr:MAG: hypothetical protein A3E52_11345 [Burkholderiales bacterium RIFCSPHIGHO2_12_FULL_63_20]OGB64524.1 MAG: hypothetical protein A3G29_03385 [Burkholderiales bacterium RIFCSPLOWO2_12_FULL_64_99]